MSGADQAAIDAPGAKEPGRWCPLSYKTSPQDFRDLTKQFASTLYVIGGLYGNHHALEQILRLREKEISAGLSPPVLVFNGDSHWFDADPSVFADIEEALSPFHRTAGNVELELAEPTEGAGCGCAYPPGVADDFVERSNAILQRLRAMTQSHFPETTRSWEALPRLRLYEVAGERIGVLHGDPESVAGWGLGVESLPPEGTLTPRLREWFERGGVRVLASTHTCRHVLRTYQGPDHHPRVVANNGAAGMPNFSGGQNGLLTRLSEHPCPLPTAAGTILNQLYCDALPFPCVSDNWLVWFDQTWPDGSAASVSYRRRLLGEL